MTWIVACAEAELVDGRPVAFRSGDEQLAVCRVGDDIFAFDNVCTHQFALLSDGYVEDGCIECPLHAGRFDLKTGEALGPPVTDPIKVYSAKIDNGHVMVDLV
jgi:3-phenylpropionate/trans-cinnamate dioxygenase ferredoxin subunit